MSQQADDTPRDDQGPGSSTQAGDDGRVDAPHGRSEPVFFEEEPGAAGEAPGDVGESVIQPTEPATSASDESPPTVVELPGPAAPDVQRATILTDTDTAGHPRTTCSVCGNETEGLAFCGHCGASLSGQAPSTEARASRAQRVGRRVRGAVMPSAGPVANAWQLAALLVIAGLAILALLFGSVGIAMMLGAALVPVLLATTMPRLDLYGRESPALFLLAALGGSAVGLIAGMAMAWVHDRWWFESGALRFGAAGYGGDFATAAGEAPLSVLLLNGVVLPALALGVVLAVAYALRRWHQLRNEVMDGMTLGAITGAGWAVGTAVVFAWPVARSTGPAMSVPDWTLLLLGLTLLRPIGLTAAAAVVGAAVWRARLGPRAGGPVVLALVAIACVLLLGIGTIIFQPRNLEAEVAWNLAIAVVAMVTLRLALRSALTFDRRTLAGEQVPTTARRPLPTAASDPFHRARTSTDQEADAGPESIVARTDSQVISAADAVTTCAHCGQRTPAGSYCANCGRPLNGRGGA